MLKLNKDNNLYDLSTLIAYVTILVAVFFMLVLYLMQTSQINDNIKERGYSALNNLIVETRNSLQKGERSSFQSVLDKTSILEDITSVSLYTSNYLMTYKSHERTVGLPFLKVNGHLKNPNIALYEKTNGSYLRDDWSFNKSSMEQHNEQMSHYNKHIKMGAQECSSCHYVLDDKIQFDEQRKASILHETTSHFYYNIPVHPYCINCHTHWKVGDSAGYLDLEMNNEKVISQSKSRLQYFGIILAVVILSFLTIGYFIKSLNKKLQSTKEELTTQVNLDSMTGLYNRRYFYQVTTKLLPISKRNEEDIFLIMLDIDNFKSINDTYGHDIGDKVIITLASEVVKITRQSDIVARWGGEEFLILLQNTNEQGAYTIAQKIRTMIESLHVEINESKKLKFTISLGYSHVMYDKDTSIDDAIKRADTAMYRAKESGKNKICNDQSSPT